MEQKQADLESRFPSRAHPEGGRHSLAACGVIAWRERKKRAMASQLAAALTSAKLAPTWRHVFPEAPARAWPTTARGGCFGSLSVAPWANEAAFAFELLSNRVPVEQLRLPPCRVAMAEVVAEALSTAACPWCFDDAFSPIPDPSATAGRPAHAAKRPRPGAAGEIPVDL